MYFLLLSVKTRTAVPPRWQQQRRLPHGNKVSSVDAHICVATCPLTLEVTPHMDRPSEWPQRWACHKRRRECHLSVVSFPDDFSLSRMKSLACETNLSVDTYCKEHGVLDPRACQTGHDMPPGLASLTQFLCCASHNSAMEMPRVLSSAHAISMTSVQRVLDQPVCSMLDIIARPDSQSPVYACVFLFVIT